MRSVISYLLTPVFCLLTSSFCLADTGWGDSPPVWVNTQGLGGATVVGRVLSGGLPVASAAVNVQPGNYGTQTLSDGTFALGGIPVGSGYQISVLAGGYAPLVLANRVLYVGSNNLGDLVLTPINGTFVLKPLQPDINPSVNDVEQGGYAYRYYRVVNAATNAPQGGVTVQVRSTISGSTLIEQDTQPHPGWAGTVAGVSDQDSGIVRLCVPAPSTQGVWSYETLIGGMTGPTFWIEVLPRQYEHFWVQESRGGLHGKVNLFAGARLGGEIGHRVEVTRTFGGSNTDEEIVRDMAVRLQRGVEVSPPITGQAKVFGARAGASAGVGAGFYAELDRAFGYGFDPYSTDADEAALRLYCMYAGLGDYVPVIGPLVFFVRTSIEPGLVADVYRWSEAGFELGAYANAEATLGAKVGKQFGVGLYGNVSFEGGLRVRQRYDVWEAQRATSCGWASQVAGDVGFGLGFRPYKGTGRPAAFTTVMGNLGVFSPVFVNAGMSGEQFLTTVTEDNAGYPSEVRLTTRAGAALSGFGQNIWTYLQTGNQPDESDLVVQVELTQPIASSDEWTFLRAVSGILKLLHASGTPGFNSQFGEQAAQALFPEGGFSRDMEYEATAEMVHRDPIEAAGDVKVIIGGGFSVKFDWEKGRSFLLERGKMRGGLAYPLEVTNGAAGVAVNNTTIGNLQATWFNQAAAPITEAMQRFSQQVQAAGQTIAQSITNAGSATLTAAQGVWQVGTNITVSGWNALTGGGQGQMLRPSSLADGTITLLYGVGGMYQFTADSAPSQPVTLQLSYQDQQVVGFNEADLRIYAHYQEDAEGEPQLVLGWINEVAEQAQCF